MKVILFDEQSYYFINNYIASSLCFNSIKKMLLHRKENTIKKRIFFSWSYLPILL